MFVFVWLTLLSMIISSSTHVDANGIISFFLMANIPLYVCTTSFSIHLSVDIQVASMSAIVNSAAVNIWVHLSSWIMIFSRYVPQDWDCWIIWYLFLVSFWFCFFNYVLNWRIIALLCCVGFCHTSRWINCKYTYIPFLLNFPLTPTPDLCV